mgnify:CR=1 FL=1
MVVEICSETFSTQVLEPSREVREQVRHSRVVIVLVLVVCCVTPIHVQRPNVDGQVVSAPSFNFAHCFILSVTVPPSKPGPECVVRQHGCRPRNFDEFATGVMPRIEIVSQQKNVRVAVYIVAKVVPVGGNESRIDLASKQPRSVREGEHFLRQWQCRRDPFERTFVSLGIGAVPHAGT